MTAAAPRMPLTAATALQGLRPRPVPEATTAATTASTTAPTSGAAPASANRRTRRSARAARRINPTVPLILAGALAITTTNLTGVAALADVRTKAPKPKPSIADRGKTVREAFQEARRAASVAAQALKATLTPPTLYTVGERDTLPDIAARYGLSTASLLALNGLSWSTAIHPGQVLKLTAYGPIEPVEAEPEGPAVPAEQRHTVSVGETLTTVAAMYGVAIDSLLSANGFSPRSILYPGQLITVPPPPPPPAPEPEPEPEPTYEYASDGSIWPMDDEMRGNASVIVQVGRSLGVSDYGIVIALATAAQESTLRNLDWGDLDSVGLFQQRPSQGWGSVEELTNPWISADLFFRGRSGVTAGLLDISGWESMPLTVAAQSVQVSAYPDAYAKWESSAWAWLAEL